MQLSTSYLNIWEVVSLFCENSCKNLIIMRHAEAIKNLEKMHGGGVQDLTAHGKEQIYRTASILEELCGDVSKAQIYFQPEGRSKQTAEILARILGANSKLMASLSGVGLGIIAELNEDELERQYPDVTLALMNWRAGENGLKSYPKIPGSESMEHFAERVYRGLVEILQTSKLPIIVSTTSVINMINHLLENNGHFIRQKYEFIEYTLGGFTVWNFSEFEKPIEAFISFLEPD